MMYFSKMLAVGIVALTTMAFAEVRSGHETNNGAAGMVCPNQETVELLDFWEARRLKNIPLRASEDSVRRQLTRALEVWPFGAKVAMDLFLKVEQGGEGFLPSGIALPAPRDSLHDFKERGCGVEGIALYDDSVDPFDDDKIALTVDPILYAKLSKGGRAGLFFHEGTYKYLRDTFQVEDSILARHITACAFAQTACPELDLRDGVPADGPLYACTPENRTGDLSRNPSFHLFPLRDSLYTSMGSTFNWRLQVMTLGDLNPPTLNPPTKLYFDGLQFQGFELGPRGNIHTPWGGASESPTKVFQAKTSENPRRNFGVPLQLSFGTRWWPGIAPEEAGFTIDGNLLLCRSLRK